jgi:peptide deformylase
MKLKLHYYGHPILRQKATAVAELTPEVIKTAQDMVETMLSHDNSIGFAGPQLGVSLRMFVIREEKSDDNENYYLGPPEVIINPVLSNPSKEMVVMAEGCMSIPKLHVEVARPAEIHVTYMNLKGEIITEHLKEFRARMFMHENDHLNGVLTIDRMDPKERKKIEPMLRALKEQYN